MNCGLVCSNEALRHLRIRTDSSDTDNDVCSYSLYCSTDTGLSWPNCAVGMVGSLHQTLS